MINRIEYLTGYRWAKEICMSSANQLRLKDGPEKLLKTLQLGTVEKPESYAEGVKEIIGIFEEAMQ